MTLAMKQDIAFNPVNVGVFSADTVVFNPQLIAHLIKQLGRFSCGVFIRKIRVYHNSTSSKNKALQGRCQIVHLEGAFSGAF
jgi:hypothetical protein